MPAPTPITRYPEMPRTPFRRSSQPAMPRMTASSAQTRRAGTAPGLASGARAAAAGPAAAAQADHRPAADLDRLGEDAAVRLPRAGDGHRLVVEQVGGGTGHLLLHRDRGAELDGDVTAGVGDRHRAGGEVGHGPAGYGLRPG